MPNYDSSTRARSDSIDIFQRISDREDRDDDDRGNQLVSIELQARENKKKLHWLSRIGERERSGALLNHA